MLDGDDLLTVQQVMLITQVSRVTIWRAVRDGHLKQVKIRGVVRYRPADVKQWLGVK